MTVLCIGAHADDVPLCMGGLVRKIKNPVILNVTTGDYRNKKSKRDKILKKIYPKFKVIQLKYTDQKLDTYPLADITKDISKIIEKIKPTMIFTHFPDSNKDHELVFGATAVPLRKSNVTLLCYAVPGNLNPFFQPSVYADITQTINKKITDYEMFEEKYPSSSMILDQATHYKNLFDPTNSGYFEAFHPIKMEVKI